MNWNNLFFGVPLNSDRGFTNFKYNHTCVGSETMMFNNLGSFQLSNNNGG
jgi:hypothetical protein